MNFGEFTVFRYVCINNQFAYVVDVHGQELRETSELKFGFLAVLAGCLRVVN